MRKVSNTAYAATPESKVPKQQTNAQFLSEVQARTSCRLFEPTAPRNPLSSLPEIDNRPFADTHDKRLQAQSEAIERTYSSAVNAGVFSEGAIPRNPSDRRLSTPQKPCPKKQN